MKKIIHLFIRVTLLICFLFLEKAAFAQTVNQKLKIAFSKFENDNQLKNAISSLYVVDATSGQIVFDKNSRIGLPPASTQKIITSITALELLGNDFQYKTEIGYEGNVVNGTLFGNLFITGSGDPTLGSWRWKTTKEDSVLNRMLQAIHAKGIYKINGNICVDISAWETNSQNDAWIWQDIGNYYGAGLSALMWRENQFDVHLKSGKNIGDSVIIKGYTPNLYGVNFQSHLTSAARGTGDNAYIYIFPREIKGTIPVSENDFVISGAMPNAHFQLASTLSDSLNSNKEVIGIHSEIIEDVKNSKRLKYQNSKIVLHTEVSPTLDSIIYWFNKKSVNLYGEALLKTLAFQKENFGSTEEGIQVLKKFWKQNAIEEDELNIWDGSGLSPLNRVTTHAQVEILKYAQSKSWFPTFLNALPEHNNMTMKSGTIRGVKGFCGYHKAKNGKEYIFSFLVNNYSGSATTLVNKMYQVLDNLK